ncbi:hypothetical protein TWF281_005033 [Arthrobotrys megalospora]
MEVVGGVASTVALVEAAGKIGLLCAKYISEVRGAKDEAERMMKETTAFSSLLKNVEDMLNGPAGAKLKASQSMKDALLESEMILESLQNGLELGLKRREQPKKGVLGKLTKMLKTEDLKWPFQREDVSGIIKRLRAVNATITLALQIDEVSIVAARDHRTNLEELDAVKEAIFGSLEDQHEPHCLPQTRMEVLDSIEGWVAGPRDSCIFWLRGMAGTGKSTVARTVAEHLKNKGQLGASFFFKRSQARRNNASRFFPTLAYGLAVQLPSLMPYISKAVEDNPEASGSSFKEQFEKLIFNPLSQATLVPTVVVVIDALDECENEREIPLVLDFLGRLSEIDGMDLRIFITSRPDHAPITGFRRLSKNSIHYHDLALHDVDIEIIRRDILVFLTHEFAQIQSRHDDEIPKSWPEEGVIQQLVGIAEPLFISAATICRFVDDRHFSPKKRLDSILTACYKSRGVYPIYLTIFKQVLASMDDMSIDDKETIVKETRRIINAIVVLEVPLSRRSLSDLLGVDEETIRYRLQAFHSILRVPAEAESPVQTFHLSFREFLFDPKQESRNPFAMGEKETHETVAEDCIALLSKTLRRDICCSKDPGILSSEIDPALRQRSIPAAVAYACQFWIYHVKESRRPLEDDGSVHKFLRVHLLHWLEATSILGISSNNAYLIRDLQSIVSEQNDRKSTNLLEFLRDIERFVRFNQFIIAKAPLQAYISALLFSPAKSIVRTLFSPTYLGWVRKAPEVEEQWGALLLTIECRGHADSMVFSPDGRWLALRAYDFEAEMWDTVSGVCVHRFGDRDAYGSGPVAFSPSGKLLASGSFGKVTLWDTISGLLIQTLFASSTEPVRAVAFSPDGRHLASVSRSRAIKVWDLVSGTLVQTLQDSRALGDSQSWDIYSIPGLVFSPDSKQIASASRDGRVRVWDALSGKLLQTIPCQNDDPRAVIFSPDCRQLACGATESDTIELWDIDSGALIREFRINVDDCDEFQPLEFSSNGKQLWSSSSSSEGGRMILWDTTSGRILRTIRDPSCLGAMRLSPDGTQVASSWGTIKLWQLANLKAEDTDGNIVNLENRANRVEGPEPRVGGGIHLIRLSPDNRRMAVLFKPSSEIEVWDTVSRSLLKTLPDILADGILFSPNSKQLAVAFESPLDGLQLWNIDTGKLMHTFKGRTDIRSVVFSSDGGKLAYGSQDDTIRVWDVVSGALVQTLSDGSKIDRLAFSSDGTQIATLGGKRVKLWSLGSGRVSYTFSETVTGLGHIAFSPDDQRLIASGHLWELASGAAVHRAERGPLTQSLSFSENGDTLRVDTGLIELDTFITCQTPRRPLTGKLQYYCSPGRFLSLNGNDFLWFPREYWPNFLGTVGSLCVFITDPCLIHHLEIDEDLVREFWF